MKNNLYILFYGKIFCWLLLASAIVFFHIWKLSEVPKGLYADETSIGINAASISSHGYDQYGTAWPVFFKAFGEYKNSLYIYGVAIIFKLFGISEFTLRLTSALFFFWFVIVLGALIQRIWNSWKITFFAALTGGFFPFFFPMSRISFEVVSQLPVTVTWLLLLHMAYVRPIKKFPPLLASFLAGLMLGISVYAYSTSRFLAFLFLAGWMLFFARKKTWKLMVAGILGFVLALIPFAIFSVYNPGALTARFNVVTYVYDTKFSVKEKIFLFANNYSRYFFPKFFLIQGDPNLRHSDGFGGAIFATSFVLMALGIAEIARRRPKDSFALFIIFLTVVSPIPAGLTTGDAVVLRTVGLGICAIILSGYGLSLLKESGSWKIIFIVLSVFASLEICAYLNYYFTIYPESSILWFETYGLRDDLAVAAGKNIKNILIYPDIHEIKTSTEFYTYVMPKLKDINIQFSYPVAEPDSCVIYSDDSKLAASQLPFSDINHGLQIKMRCYGK